MDMLLAVVSPDDASDEVVRWTGRLAEALNCPWIALYVETPHPVAAGQTARVPLALALAGELGAEVITTADNDFVRGLLRVAAQRHATQIIIAKPAAPFWRFFQRDGVLRRLARESGNANVHAVSTSRETPAQPGYRRRILDGSTWSQYAIALAVVLAFTVAAVLMRPLIGPPHAAALIFLLGVVVLGSFVGRGPTMLAALVSALLWDYFFLPPVYQFRVAHEDVFVFGMYFIVALIMGQLTTRIRAQQEIERLGEERATRLYLLTRELTEAAGVDEIVRRAARQLERVFGARVVVQLAGEGGQLLQPPHPASAFTPTADGDRAAAWALTHCQHAGKFTGNLHAADGLYVPLAGGEGVLGVVGLQFSQPFPPTVHQLNLLEAFMEQIVLALDRRRLHEISEKARILDQSERLTRALLDSMSHEVRTPIAAITSATSTLVELENADPHPLQREMVEEIKEATGRLNRLVGNFLEVSRLESGAVRPSMNECDVSDLVHTALAETESELARHQVSVEVAPQMPLVSMDFVLTQQALANLLSNAALHTPAGSHIEVSAQIEEDGLSITVADNGPGIPAASLGRIFDKFYRAPNAPNGGTGLGLSLARGFMLAQGGAATAGNRRGGGAVFTLRLPLAARLESREPAL
jgi:two-component system sensor histidine kinase KdpD